MKILSWKSTAAEYELLNQIADRAVLLADRAHAEYRKQTALMDLTAAHCNGCRLDLAALLAADDFTFSHDIFGIRRHLNRKTGQIENCFSPRTAERGMADSAKPDALTALPHASDCPIWVAEPCTCITARDADQA